jgi:hypothetical protein
MKPFKAPVLLNTLLIGDDPYLLAQLSALIAKKGHYLPVIDGPRMGRTDARAEIIRRNNAVARSKAKKIVMAGLPQKTRNVFSTLFPAGMTLEFQDTTEATAEVLGAALRSGSPLTWGRQNIAIGLLTALRKKIPISFSDKEVDDRFLKPEHGYLVVCEDENELSQVIAANYAYSIGAGLGNPPGN